VTSATTGCRSQTSVRAIEPRLSKLTIDMATASRVPGLRVSLDGSKLPNIALGVPMSVDVGDHKVEATASVRIASG